MKPTRLGELCTLHYGKGLSGYDGEPDENRSVRVFGTNGPIGWTSSPLIDNPTIVIGRKGAYRGVHFSSGPSWTIDTAYFVTLRREDVDLKWLYYRLLLVDINRMDTGAAIPSTKREDFYSVGIRVPDHTQQVRIASILTTYDDLIENNRRRIQLLEHSARLLYQEWFVHLRFPGHEHVPITDGVPEGWRRTTLGEFIDNESISLQTGPFGTQLKASDYTPDGTPVINVRNIGYGTIQPEKIEFLPEQKVLAPSKHILQRGDIVFGRKGAVDRHVLIGADQDGWMQGSDCIRMRITGKDITPNPVSIAFREDGHKQWMLGQCGNKATMASLNQDVISRIPIPVPSHEVLALFDEFASRILWQVAVLSRQAEKAASARDLLLPRLMNGEVPV